MSKLLLQDIYIYPIKSLGGISLQQAEVDRTGLKYDRRWLLVDDKRMFISQRTIPQMALLQVSLENDAIHVTHKQALLEPLIIPIGQTTKEEITVTIWDDTCIALAVSNEADKWFSNALKIPVRLVYMPDETQRLVDERYATNNEVVSFADAYPFLIIGQASLDDLNTRLSTPLPVNRFRPNFIFTGAAPYFEDSMSEFTIGDITFNGVKRCARCVLITINQDNATKGKEPLKTLASYRTINNKVVFGQNLLHKGTGIVKTGDEIILQISG